eukprot:1398041-Ditylum_brightwellii.AAC.1
MQLNQDWEGGVISKCVQSNPGNGTVIAQQKRLLLQQGKDNHNPQKQWDQDFIKIIQKWKSKCNAVVQMGDANRGLDHDGLADVIITTWLYDMMGKKHGIDPY